MMKNFIGLLIRIFLGKEKYNEFHGIDDTEVIYDWEITYYDLHDTDINTIIVKGYNLHSALRRSVHKMESSEYESISKIQRIDNVY